MGSFGFYKHRVIDWAKEKGIFEKGNPVSQFQKTVEEIDELGEALYYQEKGSEEYTNSKGKLVNTRAEIEDAFGDILVTLIIGAEMQGLNLTQCLEGAYNIISKRTGKMVDGMFVKDSE